MPTPTLLLSPDGSRDRNGAVTPTLTGGVLTVPGQYGNAWQVAESTTNLVTNPRAQNGIAGWSVSGARTLSSVPTPSPLTVSGVVIEKCFTHTTPTDLINNRFNQGVFSFTMIANMTYSISMYVYVPSSWTGGDLEVAIADRSGTGGLVDMGKRDQWQRVVSAGWVTGPINLVDTQVQLRLMSLSGDQYAGQQVYYTAVQLEQKAYATPYCDGSLGAGHTWTGTPHASTSTRAGGAISTPLVTAPQSVLVRYRENGGTLHLDAHRIGAGTFGIYGDIAYSGGTLTLSPVSHSVSIESALIYDTALTDAEIAEITGYPGAWDWGRLAASPTIAVTSAASIRPGQSVTRTASISVDYTDTWTATVAHGDGSSVETVALTGTSLTFTHTYTKSGEFRGEVTVASSGGAVARAMFITIVNLTTSRISLTPIQVVTVDGSPQNALTVTTQHGVNRPKGTATFTLQRPETTLDELRDRWLNRPIEAQIGYHETGGARRVFSGRVASISRSFDNRGYGLQVRAVGWASLLDFESEEDIVFAGRTSLYDIVRSLCQMRGLPMYGGDLITYPDSTEVVRLGGIPFVDDGNVIIPRRTSPLRWITQKLELFGYRAYDRPDGMFWWQRVNGAPAGEAVQSFAQGLSLLSASRDDDTDGMVTWWDVEGASWTDDDGISIKIRSFPAVVPDDDDGFVTPPGYVRQSLSDPALVSQDLADAVRNAHELDTLGPYETETWRYVGNTAIQPGDVAAITSDLLELSAAKRWVMAVDHAASSRGIRTTWQGWTGPGEALAAGDDSETIEIRAAAIHLGDEWLGHYVQPAPQGKVISFDISIPDTYTALILEGWAHGCNSQMIGNTNTEIEVSKLEVWQGGDKAVGTATLPTMPEDYALQLPYGSGTTHWQRFRIPVPGRLTPGVATVKLIAGENSNSGTDDYEIQQLNLVTSGNGYPVLPTGGS